MPRLLKKRVRNGRVYIRPIQNELSLESVHVLPSDEEYEKVSIVCIHTISKEVVTGLVTCLPIHSITTH